MKPIYLEPDEEITSVIDKISTLSDRRVALVVPKNGSLLQSVVNLKLLAKEAKNQDKEIVLVSTNRVGILLAKKVGLAVYPNLGAVGPATAKAVAPKPVPTPVVKDDGPQTINGVTVNQYNPAVPSLSAPPTSPSLSTAEITDEPLLSTPTAADLAEETETPTDRDVVVAAPTEVSPDELGDEPGDDEESADEAPIVSPVNPGDNASLPPIIPRTIASEPSSEPFRLPWKAVVAGVVLVLIALVVCYLFIPKATATVTFPADPVTKSMDLTVATATVVNQPNTIAGNGLTASESGSQTITASGQKNIGVNATGSITLYNKGSSSSVTLAAGTQLSAQGQTFTLDKATTIPGASVSGGSVVAGQTANVAITATDAGTDSNLANATFAVSNQSSLVYGNGSTSGGTTQQVTVLLQSDIDSATTALKTSLQNKATADLQVKATKQTVLTGSTWQNVSSQTVDQPVGAQVSSATLKMTVQAGVIAFNASSANTVLTKAAISGIAKGKQLAADPKISLAFKSLADNQSSMLITAALNGYAVSTISSTKLAGQIAHRSVSQAATILKQQDNAAAVKITLSPSWWPKQLPVLSQAIEIKQQFSSP